MFNYWHTLRQHLLSVFIHNPAARFTVAGLAQAAGYSFPAEFHWDLIGLRIRPGADGLYGWEEVCGF